MDRSDGLAHFRRQFHGIPQDSDAGDGGAGAADTGSVVAYLDGNSLGRPTRASLERIQRFLADAWGGRLIRGWDEEWMELPFTIGDAIGRAAIGAAPGQTFIGDSTTVMLYKLARAAVDSQLALRDDGPFRTEIVVDTDNFPTDRYVLEGIARERGLTLRWIESDTAGGRHARAGRRGRRAADRARAC